MKRKILAMLAITALMSLTVTSVLADEIPIEDFKVVKAFPTEMIAGSTYEAVYRLKNSALQSIPIQMYLKIEHPAIGKGEWSVMMNGINTNEIEAGVFQSNIYYIEAETQFEFKVEVSSSPNIIPAEYTFTMELWSGSVKVYPPEEPEEIPPPPPVEISPEEIPPPEEIPLEKLPPTRVPERPPAYPLAFWVLILLTAVITIVISLKLIYDRYNQGTLPQKAKKKLKKPLEK